MLQSKTIFRHLGILLTVFVMTVSLLSGAAIPVAAESDTATDIVITDDSARIVLPVGGRTL